MDNITIILVCLLCWKLLFEISVVENKRNTTSQNLIVSFLVTAILIALCKLISMLIYFIINI